VSDFEPERDAALITSLAAALSYDLRTELHTSLSSYIEQVAIWNQKVDLTAARGAQALCEVLLADAFMLADRELVPERAKVLDVGTGAGAPIIPLLLLRPDLSALCLEPLHKRAAFLRTASARLSLVGRMRVQETRLDPDRPSVPGEQLDVACSRATFPPARWLELALTLAPQAIVLVANKDLPPAPAGAQIVATRNYTLPSSGAQRRIASYRRA
jgi:16S rRNA (guanine527-N7)-methyltransferase